MIGVVFPTGALGEMAQQMEVGSGFAGKLFFGVASSIHLFPVNVRKIAGVWLEAAACWAGADGQPVSFPTVLSGCSCPTVPYLPCPFTKLLTLVTECHALFENLAMYSKKPLCM